MTDSPHLGDAHPTPLRDYVHVHDWGDPTKQPAGRVVICRFQGCGKWAVRERRRRRWRVATGDELLSIVARMMEDIAIAQAMQMIHGPERGLARARYLLGAGPPA